MIDTVDGVEISGRVLPLRVPAHMASQYKALSYSSPTRNKCKFFTQECSIYRVVALVLVLLEALLVIIAVIIVVVFVRLPVLLALVLVFVDVVVLVRVVVNPNCRFQVSFEAY